MNKCRTDSTDYNDPNDLMTNQEEKDQDALEQHQLDSFFNSFDKTNPITQEIISDIADSETIQCTLKAMIICAIRDGFVSEEATVRDIRNEAKRIAKNFIEDGNVFWNID